MSKKQVSSKERRIFLSNMNSWFSNFIIEEFRTDYIQNPKINNMGTLNTSGDPLPHLFEAKEIEIEIGYNYNQEVFSNDIIIYNLDDSNLSEVEFVIKGLKSLKFENEKILILISNIMTWANTPLKIKNDEEIKNIENFNDEEFIVPPIEPDIDIPIKIKEEDNNNVNDKEDKNSEKDKMSEKSKNSKKRESLMNKKEEKKEEEKEEEKKDEEKKEEEKKEEENKEDKKEEEKEEEKKPKERIYYYKESEYRQRIPHKKYFQYKVMETLALSILNPNLKVYIICPGFIYGCGEDIFFEYFRKSWLGNPIQILGNGINSIPTIHILDLIQLIKKIIEKKPNISYVLACDKTKNPSMKNIIKNISKAIGNGKIITLNDFNIDQVDIPNFIELNIDVKIKPSILLLDDNDEENNKKKGFKWHCEYGIPENHELIRNEFNIYRGLKSVKILICGPPCSGIIKILAAKISKIAVKNPNTKNFHPLRFLGVSASAAVNFSFTISVSRLLKVSR